MKELSIEEKAKAYDKAIQEAKDLFVGRKKMYNDLNTTLEHLFPELKEHDDERTKNQLIDFVKLSLAGFPQCEKYIAWINKHCEQKISDKVEPKFKVGDWVVDNRNGVVHYIANIKGTVNGCYYVFGYDKGWLHIDNENDYHLWTISDAKDGDVLYINNTLSESIMIYKSFNNEIINKYASYNKFGFEGENYLTLNDGYIVPATKEQRDSLIKAMTEAGYVFDFNKKELKKVNSDVQSTKSKYTENDVITGELLIKNGFEHRSGKFSDCYDIKFNAEGYIDLIQDKKSNTEWTLEILKHNDDDHSTCANRLVETISTIKELQDCLDKMNINLKIKY